ncbi:MarR family winged helix-turn-helix transcriptional regulator [Acetobacterium woodii]|uniref:Transcriptional regulator MarR family n=1 Tax=Acetobacterium woodii (strain ATCC 29683 / DSM 1030 / JCM 2381 / KCTC 1655 / WB1) TaxID=931626 RepID=H6LEB7_ACEWD|nr:MarR family transcriptional regulator [Acetobacterium woodii]AFA46831.1 transcriptional regulator MarR family [Acetobacterium woodii DSM 1030]
MKEDVNSVIDEYIKMVERIANGKTNILDFGDDMVFYRGEIHMIKMIGDFPGIFMSEMARNFNITRAVVSKTIKKLEAKDIVFKQIDASDKKRICLYLTAKGKEAYLAHQNYHNHYDSPLFNYLDELEHEKLVVIEEFLKKANQLIENHF